MLIPIAEYAAQHDRSPVSVRQKAARGGFATAVKIGRDWLIDSDEPYSDHRRAGEPDVLTTFTITDTYTDDAFTGDLQDAIDWTHSHWLNPCPDDAREQVSEALDQIRSMMENASYNERRMIRAGKHEWLNNHSAPLGSDEALQFLGAHVTWNSIKNGDAE